MKQKLGMVLYTPLYEADGDSFISRDAFGHACAASNALWRPAGRELPGANGRINCGSAEALDNLGTVGNYQFSLGAWVKPFSLGENGYGSIVNKFNGAETSGFGIYMTSTARVRFKVRTPVGAKYADPPSNSVPFNTWSFIFGAYNGANALFCTNGTWVIGDAITGAISDHSASDLYIGNNVNNNRCFDGIIGDVFAFNRALAPQEAECIYLATKWRYQ